MNEGLHHRIESLIDLRRHREAEVLLTSALAEEPDDTRLLGLAAQNLIGLDRPGPALDVASRLVATDPDDDWGHRLRSIALGHLNRHDEAQSAAAEAIRCAPFTWQTHLQFAQASTEVRGALLDAQAAADRAVQLAPHEPDAHFIVGLVAQQRRWDDAARQAYHRALALDPEHTGALHNLALLEGGGIRKRAQGMAGVLRLDPQDASALENVDALAARFVRRLYWFGLAALIVGLVMSVPPEHGMGVQASPASRTVAALLVAGGASYTWFLARGIPRGIRQYVAPRLLREPFLAALSVLTVAMLGSALLACLAPQHVVAWGRLLRLIGLVNIVMLVWGTARSRS